MPRPLRYTLTGLPQHIVQRGNNKQGTFFRDADREYYLACLHEAKVRHQLQVHAYTLMSNHIHLLVTPLVRGAISRVIQSVGRRYVRFVNAQHARTGTLWEGRHRASLVQTDMYLANCHVYIELNPVRAGMVAHAEDYRWSSARHYLGLTQDPLITDCASFLATAPDLSGRIAEHRRRLTMGLSEDQLGAIRTSTRSGAVIGTVGFGEAVAQQLGVAPRRHRRGRPRQPPSD